MSMKKLAALILAAALTLCSCAAGGGRQEDTTEYAAAVYRPIGEVDHCVVEPDEAAVMSDNDREQYERLMDAMLSREDEVDLYLAGDRAEFLLELLRESPYYYFVSSAGADGGRVSFTYAYSAEEQADMLALIDREILRIANSNASDDDNELDVILKVYSAVGHSIDYDNAREDNKQLGSPLFEYPGDEIYRALSEGKGLCQAFAYVARFALLQRGIDCFCVYGECRARDMGHMWLVFRCGGRFYNCDPAWDRASYGYSKLVHFGKTDSERIADTLEARDFAEYHYAKYGRVECTDDRFRELRGIVRYTYLNDHRYYLEDRDGNSMTLDTESGEIE